MNDRLNSMMDYVLRKHGYNINQHKLPPEYEPIRMDDYVFIFGECNGVLLSKKGRDDDHIVVHLIGEDDGFWFISDSLGSSGWHDDFQNVMNCLAMYYKKECVPDMYDGVQYGYRFKSNDN